MKNFKVILLVIIGFSTFTQAQTVVKIDLNKSVVNWSASYAFDFGGHEGTVKIKEGALIKTGDKFTGGSFVVDMNTIANTDGDYSQNLVDHLKNEDFFEVDKYPTSGFEITNVTYHKPNNTIFGSPVYIRVQGKLTIKGTTRPIHFEAEINPANTVIDGKFKIDRTIYGVNYQSKSTAGFVKDGIISDAIEFRVQLHIK